MDLTSFKSFFDSLAVVDVMIHTGGSAIRRSMLMRQLEQFQECFTAYILMPSIMLLYFTLCCLIIFLLELTSMTIGRW